MPVDRGGRARDEGLLVGYLTADLAGIGGRVREQVKDLRVEEIPAYGPTGDGQHTLFGIEKRGISTMQAIERIALALSVPASRLGCAGL